LQVPWQSVGRFIGQAQAADWHCLPPVQVTPQAPQFCWFQYGSVHCGPVAPWQQSMLDGHVITMPSATPRSPHWPATQVPFTHTAPEAQALPHPPQFWLSFCVFAQAFPHST
jgi:hypothetical protein